MHFFTLLVLVNTLLAPRIVHSIKIVSPPSLREVIPFSPASFGVPYHTLRSRPTPLRMAYPIQGCAPLKPHHMGTPIQKGAGNHSRSFYEKTVVLMYRGGCSFVQKASQAQDLGASGVIIVNDQASEGEELFVMSDDGTGHSIDIPVSMITRVHGHKLWSMMKSEIPIKVVMGQEMYQYYY